MLRELGKYFESIVIHQQGRQYRFSNKSHTKEASLRAVWLVFCITGTTLCIQLFKLYPSETLGM